MGERPLATFDIECYKDYFLINFRELTTGRTKGFELHPDMGINLESIASIVKKYTLIDFNGEGYDKHVLAYALSGASNRELKRLSDEIIVERTKTWLLSEQFGYRPIERYGFDHIDVMGIPAGKHGLKLYGARLHCPKLQELPIDPSASISPDQRIILKTYCDNDLYTTGKLYEAVEGKVKLREFMSAQYGMDLRSKSDAQIAEAVIISMAESATGKRIYKPEIDRRFEFQYQPPLWMKFRTKQMQHVFNLVKSEVFHLDDNGSPIVPDSISRTKIQLGDSVYNLTIGGLHSTESKISHFADCAIQIPGIARYAKNGMILEDIDATSFYPRLIICNNWFPKHIGPKMIEVLTEILSTRVKAKRSGDKDVDSALKIVLNSSFGKFGSKYSKLYAPDLMCQVTLTGQLSLLMLIERLEAIGVSVISGNTDGLVTYYHESQFDEMRDVIRGWELETNINMEYTPYAAILNANVNSYIAIKPDGKAKAKGAYALRVDSYNGKDVFDLSHNPQFDICNHAVVKLLTDGIAIEKTIMECRDIRKFLCAANVTGGAEYVVDHHDSNTTELDREFALFDAGYRPYYRNGEYDPSGLWLPPGCRLKSDAIEFNRAYTKVRGKDSRKYLGKVVRFAWATGMRGHIENKKGNTTPLSDGCRDLMNLPEIFPDWIDYQRYINRAKSMIQDLGI